MISVIVPVYNAEKFIKRVLESLMVQTYEDFEVIIIDDGSTDGSMEICPEYHDYFSMQICDQAHAGVGAARNNGLQRAKGDWIFFLDADDYLLPHALETLASRTGDIVVGGVFRQAPDGTVCKLTPPTKHPRAVLGRDDITDCILEYLRTNDAYLVSHCWGRLYDRSMIERFYVRFPNIKVGEDGVFNILCLMYAQVVTVVDEPLYGFQIHGGSSAVSALRAEDSYETVTALRSVLNSYFEYFVVDPFIGRLERILEEYGGRDLPSVTSLAMLSHEDILIEKIKSGPPVVIYGADVVGKVLLDICRKAGLGVVGFADYKRDLNEFCGLPVRHAPDLEKNASYIISVIAIRDVVKVLQGLGITTWYAGGMLLTWVDTAQIAPQLDEEKHQIESCRIAHRAFLKPDYLFVRSVDVMITERCSLRCRDCSNLMQYFNHPKDYNLEDILNDVDRFLQLADEVLEARVIGGDAFMNLEWPEVVRRLIDSDKVRRVIVYTNGIIVPWPLKGLTDEKVIVYMTDYGKLSKNLDTAVKWFTEHKVRYKIVKVDRWIDCASVWQRNRSEEQNDQLFAECVATNLTTLVAGRVFRCPYAASLHQLNLISGGITLLAPKADLRDYLISDKATTACDFCNGRILGNTIPPAIQTKERRLK